MTRPRPRHLGLIALLAAVVLVAVVSVLVGQRDDAPPAADAPQSTPVQPVAYLRTPQPGDDFPRLPADCYDASGELSYAPCRVVDTGARSSVVVWGDSHAWMYLPALVEAAHRTHVDLVMVVAGGCPPAVPAARTPGSGYTRCEQHDAATLDYLHGLQARGKRFRLVLGAFWSGYRAGTYLDSVSSVARSSDYAERMNTLAADGTAPLFTELARMRVGVDVIGQAATVPEDAPACAAGRTPYQCDLPRTAALPDEAGNHAWLSSVMSPLPGHPRYIDPSSVYCDATTCHHDVDGVDTWFDDIHLGARLTATMARFFVPSFTAAASPSA